MASLGDIGNLATVGLIGVGGLILLQAVGGIKGLQSFFEGIAGTGGAISGAASAVGSVAGAVAPVVNPPAVGPFVDDLTRLVEQIEQQGYATPEQQQVKEYLEAGTTAQQLVNNPFFTASTPWIKNLANSLIGTFYQTPEVLEQPVQQPAQETQGPVVNVVASHEDVQKAVQEFYSADQTIQELTRRLQAHYESQQTVAVSAPASRVSSGGSSSGSSSSRYAGLPSSQIPSGSTATLEQNQAKVEAIRQEEGNAAADRAAMFLRL